jgi:hypothetical protein
MNFSPTLHKSLLAGVARAPLAADAPLQDVLTGVPAPLRLWHLVAATALWQRAGFAPAQAQGELVTPCPAAPTCPRSAERVLQLILAGIHTEQLAAWLALARRHGMAVPHGLLVPLLELGVQKPALHADLAPVLGQRGHWLVAQHPEWSTHYGVAADPDDPQVHWQLGTLTQRVAALAAMRRADPAAALAALQAEWPNEPPEHRAALLPMLGIGLGPQDEAFLERALDDKRKEVRVAAQRCLAALPGSQLAARCKARLAALFTLKHTTGLLARVGAMLGGALPELTLTLPETCDKAMKRDGIGSEQHRGLGEKAGWLLDLVRAVPPVHWSETWQLAPQEVYTLFARHEFSAALTTGLVDASTRTLSAQPDQAAFDWIAMLARQVPPKETWLNIRASLLAELHRLPQAEQERTVQFWCEHPPGTRQVDPYALDWAERRYGAATDCLPPALSQLMLAGVQRAIRANAQADYQTRQELAILGRTLDPAILAAAQAHWPAPDWEHWPQWRDPVDKFMDTLQFRKTMQASFLETDG